MAETKTTREKKHGQTRASRLLKQRNNGQSKTSIFRLKTV
jgi:hypothetical protein